MFTFGNMKFICILQGDLLNAVINSVWLFLDKDDQENLLIYNISQPTINETQLITQ